MISILKSQWFSDFFNLKKKKTNKQTNKQTKQTQISRIKETNILIENPKAQNKSKYLKLRKQNFW